MSNVVLINNQSVSFEVVGYQTYTTSLDIASVFEKRHDNILAQIRELPQDDFNALNFKEIKYQDQKGELRPCYKLTRDGFSLLVMGFTGEKAYRWKIEFINAFNKMENMLKGGGSSNQALNLIASAMQTMLSQNSTILELLKKQKEPFALCDKPTSRIYHRRLSNEEKFIEKVIAVLKKEEGINQGELLARVGTYKDNRSALNWLHSYDGIYWRANLLDAGRYTYSYSLIQE
ncbi:Rha family transcriptional regulator [Campylobacter sp. faydin G-24]|uniref:Rha family transcriptional regulator n=1 Tax=Campylobacter anatolicus TaxID=2829105 RepID=A0ABS5HH84_9BACT|nr:Rha family transcriptional regulator [Campylobacter anatolicus]MBR8463644.1 Rha family transcriptional regulator [Campylobacter anatolicus]